MAYTSSHTGSEHDTYVTKSDFINLIYPVGSIYISTNSTEPATLFGGTWARIQDTFLLMAGDTYTAGSTGGSATMAHTHSQVAGTTGGPSNNTSGSTALTVANLPSHYHELPAHTWAWGNQSANNTICIRETVRAESVTSGNYMHSLQGNWNYSLSTGSGTGHTHTLSSHTHSISATTTGGASNTDNMPPYLVVYCWKRTA